MRRIILGTLVVMSGVATAAVRAQDTPNIVITRGGTRPSRFDADRLITVSVSGRPTSDAEFDDAIERLEGVVGVQAAAAGRDLRRWGSGQLVRTAEGDPLRGGHGPSYNFVDPDYFRVAGLRLIAGHTFTEADGAAPEPVAVITEGAGLPPGRRRHHDHPLGCHRGSTPALFRTALSGSARAHAQSSRAHSRPCDTLRRRTRL